MSTSRETLCVGYILCGQNTKICSAAVGVTYSLNSALIDWFYLLKIPMFFFQINPAVANTVTIHTSHCTQPGNVFFVFHWILVALKNMSNVCCKSHFKLRPVFCNMNLWTVWQNLTFQQKHLTVIRLDIWVQLLNTTW